MKTTRPFRFLPALILISVGLMRASAMADAVSPAQLPEAYRNVGVDEHLNTQLPLDLQLIDENAQFIKLGDVFHPNRPVLMQLGYLGCPMLCDAISRSLIQSAKKTDLTIGKDFDFVFISIDPTDSADLAREKKNSYVLECDQPGSGGGIHILVARPKQIEEIAAAVGFRYQPAANGQFAHPAVAMIVTPDGKLSRYIYGVTFPPQTLRLSLVEASQGKIGTSMDQILLICLHWDPTAGKYSMAAMNLMRLGGVLTMIVLASAVVFWMVKYGHHGPSSADKVN